MLLRNGRSGRNLVPVGFAIVPRRKPGHFRGVDAATYISAKLGAADPEVERLRHAILSQKTAVSTRRIECLQRQSRFIDKIAAAGR